MTHARRTDGNLKAIVKAARALGFLVYVRNDVWDLDAAMNGKTEIWEVKQLKGRYKPSQEKMLAAGWPVRTIRTVEDVLEARNRFIQ